MQRLNEVSAGGGNGEPMPTKSRGADRQDSKKLLGSERCNDDTPHLQPQLLTFELAPGLPATIALNGQKIPQYYRGKLISPCHIQLIHRQVIDRSSRLRSVATWLHWITAECQWQSCMSRHMRSLGRLRRISQTHPRDGRSLRQIANIQCANLE
ncbi:hypothetical protein D9M68_605840 [compost metagenome]